MGTYMQRERERGREGEGEGEGQNESLRDLQNETNSSNGMRACAYVYIFTLAGIALDVLIFRSSSGVDMSTRRENLEYFGVESSHAFAMSLHYSAPTRNSSGRIPLARPYHQLYRRTLPAAPSMHNAMITPNIWEPLVTGRSR